MKRIATIIAALMLLAMPREAGAQITTTSISGRVMDGDWAVEGAAVIAIDGTTGAQYSTETDGDGYYALLEMLPGGPYTVRIVNFNSGSVTVKGVYTFLAENTVIDVDLENGKSTVRRDGAAAATYVSGGGLSGGIVSAGRSLSSNLNYFPQKMNVETYGLWTDVIGQMSVSQIGYDVRQDGDLLSATVSATPRLGTSKFHASVYDYFTTESLNNVGMRNMTGFYVSTPVVSDDCVVFATGEYNSDYWNALARADLRLSDRARLSANVASMEKSFLASGELVNFFAGGKAANNLAAAFFKRADDSRYAYLSDNYTFSARNQKFLAGGRVVSDTRDTLSRTRFDFYFQDEIAIARRLSLKAGLKMGFPFTFSPRLSFNYDVFGTQSVVLRGGTAIYDVNGAPSTWKMSFGLDKSLPADFKASVDWMYGQYWNRMFHISSANILDRYNSLTGKIEHPFGNNVYALAAYTVSNKFMKDRLMSGFSYKWAYSDFTNTSFAASFQAYRPFEGDSAGAWKNALDGRVTQEISFNAGGLKHVLQLTLYGMKTGDSKLWMITARYSF